MKQIIESYNKNKDDSLFLSKLEHFIFPLKIVGFKLNRNNLPVISELKDIPPIDNKKILYNEKFIEYFYRIFWELIRKLGVATQNFYSFVEDIVFEINRITTKDYVLYDCHSTDNYNCGRAMIVLNKYPSQFLIFNTDDKGYIDEYTQYLYMGCPKKDYKDGNLPINYDKFENRKKRVENEIKKLKKDFDIQVAQINNGIKLYLRRDKILITFTIPYNYPFEAPSGTFNDLSISDIDIDWELSSSLGLEKIIDKLMTKYNNNKFPKHRKILCYLLSM